MGFHQKTSEEDIKRKNKTCEFTPKNYLNDELLSYSGILVFLFFVMHPV